VLEVRAHEVPILLEDRQIVGRLVYHRMADVPDKLYGQAIGSSYQQQGLALSKQFRTAVSAQAATTQITQAAQGAWQVVCDTRLSGVGVHYEKGAQWCRTNPATEIGCALGDSLNSTGASPRRRRVPMESPLTTNFGAAIALPAFRGIV
jgi:hypothetical protein